MPVARAPSLAEGVSREPSIAPRQLGLPASIILLAVVAAGFLVATSSGFALLWFVPYAGVGALLAIRRPQTSIGWLLLGLSFSQLPLTGPAIDAARASFADGSLPLLTKVYAVAHAVSGPSAFVLYATLAMVLPSGRFPPNQWGRIGRGAIAFLVLLVILTAIGPTIDVNLKGSFVAVNVPNPFSVLPDLLLWRVVNPDQFFAPWFAVFAAAVVSLGLRARRSTGVERQQLRWIGTALAFVVVAVAIGFVISALLPDSSTNGIAWTPAIIAFPTIPLAIGVAVLRYRLYEIDTIINRAIVYGLLTAIVAGVSAAAIALTQRLFSGVIGAASDLTIVLITLAVVAAVNPVKMKLQVLVDRRFKEVRDPGKELAAFLADVHGSLSRPDRDRTLQRFLEAAVLAFGAFDGELTLEGAGRERLFHADGRAGSKTGVGATVGEEQLRASTAHGRRRAEMRLSGVEWSRGASALEPALSSVLAELDHPT